LQKKRRSTEIGETRKIYTTKMHNNWSKTGSPKEKRINRWEGSRLRKPGEGVDAFEQGCDCAGRKRWR